MIDSWDDRGNVIYVWNEHHRCLAYAWRQDDGRWKAKLTGPSRITFGPYLHKDVAARKLGRLVVAEPSPHYRPRQRR